MVFEPMSGSTPNLNPSVGMSKVFMLDKNLVNYKNSGILQMAESRSRAIAVMELLGGS